MKAKCNKFKIASIYFIVIFIAVFSGCKSDNFVSPEHEKDGPNGYNVSVSVHSENTENDNNSLILTETKFVLRQMRLKESGSETTAAIRLEPFVINLNVTSEGATYTVAVATVPSANYDHLKLQIHKPSPQENIGDPDFFESNRSFSVVVRGLFNGNPFVFKSGVTAARGINIENSPIFITPTILVNFTISLNPYSWFYRNGDYMNPMQQNNEHYINNNIRDSFNRVFRDLDMNGHPD